MSPTHYLTLSELAERVHNIFETYFKLPVWVVAEVASLSESAVGHCYLELTEQDEHSHTTLATMRAVIWANKYYELRPFFEEMTHTTLRKGLQLLLRVKVEYSLRYGLTLQIVDIDPQYTVGAMALQRQRTLEQLEQDGVLHRNQELLFPEFPRRIAVISAERAAGYQDFCHQLQATVDRYNLTIQLFPAIVQGDNAPESIIKALDTIFEQRDKWDIVVIIRGGGGKMDLSCFDDYDLAFVLTQIPLPVVTGIGHERDVSVVDLIANKSLKTPTAVAAFLVERFRAAEQQLSACMRELLPIIENATQCNAQTLHLLATNIANLRFPSLVVVQQNLLRYIEMVRLQYTIILKHYVPKIEQQMAQLSLLSQNQVEIFSNNLICQLSELKPLLSAKLQQIKTNYLIRVFDLQQIDPRSALQMGLVLVSRKGRLLTSSHTIVPGEDLELTALRQKLTVEVKKVACITSQRVEEEKGEESYRQAMYADLLQEE